MTDFLYLLGAIGFIVGLMGLSSLRTALRANLAAMAAMGACIIGALWAMPHILKLPSVWLVILAGTAVGGVIARRLSMTALPQLMAAFHSLVGLAATCLGIVAFLTPTQAHGLMHLTELSLGTIVGALTFTGSVVAVIKLQGGLAKPLWRGHWPLVMLGIALTFLLSWWLWAPNLSGLLLLTIAGLLLGAVLVLPIGGADMPVVISMLNAYSGVAAMGIGLTLAQFVLVLVGSLVAASGTILSYVMCKGMNRPFLQVILGGTQEAAQSSTAPQGTVKKGSAQDAAFFLENARSVIIVPGYGMAVARAQHAVKELMQHLQQRGISVMFAIHPVAGRMPGHMNVLLAEADIESEAVKELDEINADFPEADVVLVIGANDITNPSARTDKSSPLYGMPILDVDKARTVLFVKRSLGAGYAAVDNPLFYDSKTYMVLGDGKKVVEAMGQALTA